MSEAQPLVGVIMGSKSDWDTMRHADEMLTEFGVAARVSGRLGAPHAGAGWPSTRRRAASRGLEVIIAGAGGAAHLPGMVAAHTVLPVLGVPVQSAALNGLDSLLSIVQMPKGVPVATVAIGTAGRGQRGAARGRHSRDVAARPARASCRRTATRTPPTFGARSLLVSRDPARRDHRRARRRPAWAHVRDGRPPPRLPRPHARARTRHADRPDRRRRDQRVLRRPRRRPRVRQRVSTSSPSSSRTCSAAAAAAAERARHRAPERSRARDRAAPHPREDVSRRSRLARRRRSRRFASDDGSARRPSQQVGMSGRRSRRRRSATTARARSRLRQPTTAAAAWDALGRREAILEAFIDLEREISVIGARGVDGAWSHFGADRERAPPSHPRRLGRAGRRAASHRPRRRST